MAPASKQLNEEDPGVPLRTGSVRQRDKHVDFLSSPVFELAVLRGAEMQTAQASESSSRSPGL